MGTLRNLTISEQNQLLESTKICKRNCWKTGWVNGLYQDAYKFDFNQDTSFRYISEGFNYYGVVTLNTLNTVLVPIDAHICNIIGNMNYTDAYNIFNK